jgi:hypothetical protein
MGFRYGARASSMPSALVLSKEVSLGIEKHLCRFWNIALGNGIPVLDHFGSRRVRGTRWG